MLISIYASRAHYSYKGKTQCGGRHDDVAILSRADVATPERNSSEINPGIKQNRIYIVKEMSRNVFSRHFLYIPFTEHYYDYKIIKQ